ncbi:hypothetical protein [Flaviaesturariibacter amylovorans]|uniref:Outer membrane protein beta-barrel domain-containing protein n=1 Tax=Flaviaesturariibacter amylovorans TaxID=1084520 RepID=A0ABP8GEK2_9BACT
MKPIKTLIPTAALLAAACTAHAQSYRNAAGARVEFGNDLVWAGASFKHRFTEHSALETSLLFGGDAIVPELGYVYMHPAFPGMRNFYANWGIGVAAPLYDGKAEWLLRPSLGLEYRFPKTPLQLGIDWRPSYRLSGDDSYERFVFGRFSVPLRFVF